MASFAHRLARQSSSEAWSSSRISKRGPNACTRIFESLRSRRCRRPDRAKIERWRCRYPAAGVPGGVGSGGTDAPLRSGRTGLSNARVDAARNAQHGAAMIAEGLKVVCVQRVDEGLSSKAPSGVLLAAPRPPRDFGNSVDHEKSVRPFKGIFCRDISEFESYMPSHAVRSPSAKMRVVPTLPIHWRVVECLNAGLQRDAPFHEMTLAQWSTVIGINLT